ncbi:MAG: hypothetical protein ACIAXF_13865 [Phycisphaerales bacterium JB063]
MNLFTQAQPAPDAAPSPRRATESPRKPAPVASSRATDPETSREAAERHEASGRAFCNRERLLAEVCAGPGRTAAELANWLKGIDQIEVSRRLPELRELGLIESRDPRKCSIKGSRMMTHWPTEAGRKAGPKHG